MTDKLESEMTAGLSVVPCTHPREKVVYTGDGTPVNWCPDCHSNRLVGGSHGPTARDTAQATIVAQAAEIERLKRERDHSPRYGPLWRELRAEIERLTRERDEARLLLSNEVFLKNLDAELGPELDALKAKQVADIDEVLAAGALMANTMFNLAQKPNERLHSTDCNLFKSMQIKRDAAREALRSHLAKDRI